MSSENLITIEAQDRISRDYQLEQAALVLRSKAANCGILITRHSFRTYTVALSPDVEYGLTHELDLLCCERELSRSVRDTTGLAPARLQR